MNRKIFFQDIVLQLWRAYPKFRGESKVSTWIYRIAINTAITSFRKKNAPIELQEHLPADNWHTENIEPSENEEKMFQAIRMLKKEDRALIALFLEDYSYREIAQIIGISENYVAVKMSRIKDKLKDILKS
ncbi:RNA polymerase sigma factor [Sphingobacterium wenxiniae]|nr:RNA polymerase sigma factor [Sphingobacterium wenxiniae]